MVCFVVGFRMPLGLLAAVAGFIWLLGAEGLNGDYRRTCTQQPELC